MSSSNSPSVVIVGTHSVVRLATRARCSSFALASVVVFAFFDILDFGAIGSPATTTLDLGLGRKCEWNLNHHTQITGDIRLRIRR